MFMRPLLLNYAYRREGGEAGASLVRERVVGLEHCRHIHAAAAQQWVRPACMG